MEDKIKEYADELKSASESKLEAAKESAFRYVIEGDQVACNEAITSNAAHKALSAAHLDLLDKFPELESEK